MQRWKWNISYWKWTMCCWYWGNLRNVFGVIYFVILPDLVSVNTKALCKGQSWDAKPQNLSQNPRQPKRFDIPALNNDQMSVSWLYWVVFCLDIKLTLLEDFRPKYLNVNQKPHIHSFFTVLCCPPRVSVVWEAEPFQTKIFQHATRDPWVLSLLIVAVKVL